MFIIGLVLAFVVVVYLAAFWGTHLSMVENHSDKWAWGNFDDFLANFAKKKWEQHGVWMQSWFLPYGDKEYDNWEIHASIIKFDGIGMKLEPLSYLLFLIWAYKNRWDKKSTTKKIQHQWR